MWSVIHSGSAFVWNAGLFVTGIQLFKAGPHTFRRKQGVLAAVDHQESCRHCQRGHIGIVKVLIQAGYDLCKSDAVSHLLPQLSWEGGHPSHRDRCLDAVIQCSQMTASQTAYRKAYTSDPVLIHLRPSDQIVHCSNVVPIHHSRPCEPGRENGSAQKLFVLTCSLVEGSDSLGCDGGGPLPPVQQVVIQQQPAFTPVEHVDSDHQVTLPSEVRSNTLSAVGRLFELRQDWMNALQINNLLLSPKVESTMVVQGHNGRGWTGRILRDQDISRNADVWSRVEIDFLADVLAAIHLFNSFGARIAPGRRVVQQLQQLPSSYLFPARN